VPTVHISADLPSINIGSTSLLSWATTDADTVTIDQGIGSVATSGSQTISPVVTTVYTITATNTFGSSTDAVTVTVDLLPSVDILANPNPILIGETTTLTWTSSNADSVSIDQGIGSVDLGGSLVVSPAVTTTYVITATNVYGSTADSITLTVYQVPAVTITVGPPAIVLGESATLSWSSTDAETASIDNGIGSVGLNGSMSIAPAVTTVYTITVTGPAGTTTGTATVTVYQVPEVTISADPPVIISGESTTLSWTSNYADMVTIDNSIGVVDTDGSVVVSPTIPTTYTITVTNPGGETTASVTVGVVPREAAYIPTYTVEDGEYSYSIAVIDLELDPPAVTYTLDNVGNKPFGIVPHPSNEYIYVSCYADQTVEKIDVFTGEVLETINVTDPPRDLAITSDGALLYVSRYNIEWNGEVGVIDTATDTMIDSIGLVNHPKSLAMSADGTRLYASDVFNMDDAIQDYHITSIIAAEHRDDVTINVGSLCPYDLEVSPDGSRVYMANLEDGLSYMNTSDYSVVPVMEEYRKSYTRVRASTDGTLVYVATYETYTSQASITVINPDDTSSITTIDISQPGEFVEIKGMAVHPTRPYLYVVGNVSDDLGLPDIYVIDTTTNTVVNTVTLGNHDDLYGDFLIIRP